MTESPSGIAHLSNGTVEIAVALEFGPRIVHYGFVGRGNELGLAPDVERSTELGVWKPRGGHRLWIAPESVPDTYAPDDGLIEHRYPDPRTLIIARPADAAGFAKEISITMDFDSGIELIHRITNCTDRSVRISAWALTIMAGGGTAIIPQEPYRAHSEALCPARPLVLWHYTDLTDPRMRFSRRHVAMASHLTRPEPQKIGVLNKQGWCAYHRGTSLFVKTVPFDEGREYPDYNCNNQVFTAGSLIELETLGPLEDIGPGGSIQHREFWRLYHDVAVDETDEALSASIASLLE